MTTFNLTNKELDIISDISTRIDITTENNYTGYKDNYIFDFNTDYPTNLWFVHIPTFKEIIGQFLIGVNSVNRLMAFKESFEKFINENGLYYTILILQFSKDETIDNVIENLNSRFEIFEADDLHDVGYYVIGEEVESKNGFELAKYFDFDSYGRDYLINNSGVLLSGNYIHKLD